MTIAVYCSAKDQIPEEYKRLGDELGLWIAGNGHTLVYGGATGGLMSRVSDAVSRNDGRVLGVIPPRILRSGRLATNCTRVYKVMDMAARKRKMRDLSDCFVALPGSYGTLDEIYDVISSGTIGEHRKPIFIVNYKGFYDGIKQEAAKMKELNFLPKEESFKPIYVETLDELFTQLNTIKL